MLGSAGEARLKAADRELFWDIVAGSAAVLPFVAYIQVGKLYHGNYGLSLEDLLPLSYLVGSWLLLGGMRWAEVKLVWTAARFWLWLSLLVGLTVRYGAVAIAEWGGAAAAVTTVLFFALGLLACRNASTSLWDGLRRLVAFLPGLIVISPLVIGQVLSTPVIWLPGDVGKQPVKTATLVLLFDEINAKDSLGLQQVLADRGLNVGFKPVEPVHESTTQVVPALFTGRDFTGARPCGLSVVCAEEAVLDFSQVSVLRSDVDVVGFHHPYCAIQGLRSCQRLTTERSIWETARWGCAAQRLLGIHLGWGRHTCQELSHASWVDLQDQATANALTAPALKQGGVLYAHLPLPHPPARGSGSLSGQYLRNVRQAEQVLGQLLDRMADNEVEPRILIFSDHPLRQSMWCSRQAAQFDAPCVVDPALVDANVPLIVAARTVLPDIERARSNREVFDVLRDWLRR